MHLMATEMDKAGWIPVMMEGDTGTRTFSLCEGRTVLLTKLGLGWVRVGKANSRNYRTNN